jgi:hypothetical protein
MEENASVGRSCCFDGKKMKIIKVENCLECPKADFSTKKWQGWNARVAICPYAPKDQLEAIHIQLEAGPREFPVWCPLEDCEHSPTNL